MSEQPYFHIGVVVPDLEKAIEYYSRMHGLDFTKPAHVTNPRIEDPHPHEQVVHVAFSKQGPPYFELIESDGDEGIYSSAKEGQILYLGFWEADMDGRMEKLRAEGIGIEAVSRSAEGATPDWIITEPDAMGVRYEYVDLAEKQAIETWIETDEFPGL
ncbi:VOC family protein [Streptomyces sp. NPDC048361]|uniref:VOC family protein n=1 Tax=Streptomyces sp. NPDC048361 TaxID=3154720 RepID=UPI00342AD1A3